MEFVNTFPHSLRIPEQVFNFHDYKWRYCHIQRDSKDPKKELAFLQVLIKISFLRYKFTLRKVMRAGMAREIDDLVLIGLAISFFFIIITKHDQIIISHQAHPRGFNNTLLFIYSSEETSRGKCSKTVMSIHFTAFLLRSSHQMRWNNVESNWDHPT
jgi:hypothetical protein